MSLFFSLSVIVSMSVSSNRRQQNDLRNDLSSKKTHIRYVKALFLASAGPSAPMSRTPLLLSLRIIVYVCSRKQKVCIKYKRQTLQRSVQGQSCTKSGHIHNTIASETVVKNWAIFFSLKPASKCKLLTYRSSCNDLFGPSPSKQNLVTSETSLTSKLNKNLKK